MRERANHSVHEDAPTAEVDEHFSYNEAWAQRLIDRGGSRTDRCERHRRIHAKAITSVAVAYVDIATLGEAVGHDAPQGPVGPLGGLGPLPSPHRAQHSRVDLDGFEFGMNDDDIYKILRLLSNPEKRVLVLKAGTGTGKSTFGPFRLLSPPDDPAIRLTDLGRIVVTEPRIQATTGVARFVGEKLVMGCPLKECSNPAHGSFNPKAHIELGDDQFVGKSCTTPNCRLPHVGKHPWPEETGCIVSDCARHIGPGFPVGYQVSDARNHDAACQLVYVTDGTMVNWLSDGRLNEIGTVIVDEAHERSSNIDFIMAYLRRDLDRYPHLRVIITSATFDIDYYENFFGKSRVNRMDVPATKKFGYGAPLFASAGGIEVFDCSCEPVVPAGGGPARMPHEPFTDYDAWRDQHWPETATLQDGTIEHPRQVTDQLRGRRFDRDLPIVGDKEKTVANAVAYQVIRLAQHLDEFDIHGDILAFLPSSGYMEPALRQIEAAISADRADLFGLIQSAPLEHKEAAIAPRDRGAKRKIVVSTNLAETSLTVSGVRFVVESGLATQSEWTVATAEQNIETKAHSQAGIRQRWGRVGRDSPGWVFPVYTKQQFEKFPRDTRPSSTRDNLEGLIVKAKAAGIDDLQTIIWPADYDLDALDDDGREGAATFTKELERAQRALSAAGTTDDRTGRLTPFGKEISRFGSHSPAFAVSVVCADQLACAPEVITALALLDDGDKPQGYRVEFRYLFALPPGAQLPEWQYQRRLRQEAFRAAGGDDLDMVLRIVSAWEHSDPNAKPWEPSAYRERFADSWWLNHSMLLQLAELRREVMTSLSPAMKEEVKRFVDTSLSHRARAAISRGYANYAFSRQTDGKYRAVTGALEPLSLDRSYGASQFLDEIIVLGNRHGYLAQIVELLPWAAAASSLAQISARRSPTFDLLLRSIAHTDSMESRDSLDRGLREFYNQLPVGTRVEAQIDTSADSKHLFFGAVTQRIAALRPQVGRKNEAGSESVSVWDIVSSGGGKATEWPTGKTGTIAEDDDPHALVEPSSTEIDGTTGRELGPETNDEQLRLYPAQHDLLEQADVVWPGHTAVGARVEIVDAEGLAQQAGWFEVIGYVVDDGDVAVQLRPSSLSPYFRGDPALNQDLELGRVIPVMVGQLIEVNGKSYRVFNRSDGHGRFFRVDGSGQREAGVYDLPVSLRSGDRDFLERLPSGMQLDAEIVPAPNGAHGMSLMRYLLAGLTGTDLDSNSSSLVHTCTGEVLALPKSDEEAKLVGGGTHGEVGLMAAMPYAESLYAFNFSPKVLNRGGLGDVSLRQQVEVALRSAKQSLIYTPNEDSQWSDVRDGLASVGFSMAGQDSQRPSQTSGKRQILVQLERPILPAQRDTLLAACADNVWQLAVWAAYQRSYLVSVKSVTLPVGLQSALGAFERFIQDHAKGQVVRGTVTGTATFGVFFRLAPQVDGLVHKTELPADEFSNLGQRFSSGVEREVRIIDFDHAKRKVKLSRRGLTSARPPSSDGWEAPQDFPETSFTAARGPGDYVHPAWPRPTPVSRTGGAHRAPEMPVNLSDAERVPSPFALPSAPLRPAADRSAPAARRREGRTAIPASPSRAAFRSGEISLLAHGATGTAPVAPVPSRTGSDGHVTRWPNVSPAAADSKTRSGLQRRRNSIIGGAVLLVAIAGLVFAAVGQVPNLNTGAFGGSSPQSVSSEDELALLRAQDSPLVESILGNWVPQLSSAVVGTDKLGNTHTTDSILADHRALRAKYGALLLSSSDYVSVRPGYWVTIANVSFKSSSGALNWCRAKNLDDNSCYAKLLTHNASIKVTARHQKSR